MEVNAKLIQQISALAGLEISLKRAKPLIPVLESTFQGDAEIARLNLNNLSPVGSIWTGGEDD